MTLRPLFLALLGLAALRTQAEDWPEFRGPTGQGYSLESGLPLKWSATENVVWKSKVPGQGWSSPVVVQGKVYLTSALLNEGGVNGLSLHALCFDAKTGKSLWDVEVFPPDQNKIVGIHSKNSHASATPIIENGKVYIHFGHHGTACLDTSGKVLWKNNSLKYSPVHGNGGSPAIVGDLLVFSCDGASEPFIAALKKQSGELAWKVPRVSDAKKKFSFNTPLLITVNGHQEIISAGSGVVSGLAPKDGHELWRVRYGEGYSVIPRPVLADGMLFIGTGYDRPLVYAIKTGGSGDVTETHVAWTMTKGAPNTPSLLVVGKEVYFVSDGGIATCADAKTGKVHWQERLGGDFSASPTLAEGRIYFLNEQGSCSVVKPGIEFEKLAVSELGERSLASPAFSDHAIFIRTAENLYRIENAKK